MRIPAPDFTLVFTFMLLASFLSLPVRIDQPFGSMPPRLPALTFVLTCMLVLQLTVVVYTSTYTALNSRFCFHSASLRKVLKVFRMWNREEQRRIN